MKRNAPEEDSMLHRLVAATNAHDLDAIVDCFAASYRNETPVHPARGFIGRDQVRTNWQHMLSGVPDIVAQVVRHTVRGATIWSEWEMRGTRRDGTPHLMRGVIIFGVEDDRAVWARFYLEPVDVGSGTVNDAVQMVAGTNASDFPK